MKKNRILAGACALVLAASLTVGALAASQPYTANATLSPNVTVKIDGVEQTFYSAQGKEVHPIIYNGTTYIPLRAVGELMGKNVNWDGTTGTASLGGTRTTGNVTGTPDTAAKRTDVTFTLRPEYHIVIDGTERTFVNANGTKIDPAIYNGSIYLPLRAIGEIMGKRVSWDGATQTVRLDSTASGGDVTDFDTNNSSQSAPTGGVTLEQAKQTALQHAGKTASQVQFVKAQQDWENGRKVYEIEFIVSDSTGYTEYDYEIDAATGKIVSYDHDAESYAPPAQSTNSGVKVTEATAKKTALSRVSGATEKDIYEWKLDYDDGRTEYEGKIIYGGMEYEFTINAATGAVTEWDAESVYD
ncbi:PepSY domain-containing protein [Colidextribacter sp. 210702-DFI.3.9]|nr:PepSY domain-containing protein [Colidextribacter sp. 210702-DFI.3.9]MCG4774715.1 stalk domain-containing protein [Lawsonibacter sp. DFI.5.51]